MSILIRLGWFGDEDELIGEGNKVLDNSIIGARGISFGSVVIVFK